MDERRHGRDVFVSASAVADRETAFDLLRTVAALAVIMVHVVGPYREQLGAMPQSEWIVAVTLNGLSRWAVPVFIMITGALMLADPRPFDSGYFLRRRVLKVLVPFLWWSVVYAGSAPAGSRLRRACAGSWRARLALRCSPNSASG